MKPGYPISSEQWSLYWVMSPAPPPSCLHSFSLAYAVYNSGIVLYFMYVGLRYIISSRFAKSGHPWSLILKLFFQWRQLSQGKTLRYLTPQIGSCISFNKHQRIFGLLPFIWPLRVIVSRSSEKKKKKCTPGSGL